MSKTPNAAEKRHLDALRQIGCIVCRNQGFNTPTAIHHLDGHTKPKAHYLTLPLCFHHHQGGDGDGTLFYSVHFYPREFREQYGCEYALLQQVQELLAW